MVYSEFPDHIYVHVPFCDGRCRYCAFFSTSDRRKYSAYAPLPAIELSHGSGGRCAPLSVYIGGGTPSCSRDGLRVLLETMNRTLDISRLREWTVEVSPRHLDDALAGMLVSHHVTRVSLGVQSFNDDVLKAMGRRHDSSEAVAAVETLRNAGIRELSMDLIADWPDESRASFQSGLDQVLRLKPDHVSIYSLSVDEGSRISKESDFFTLSDEESLKRLALAEGVLCGSGFHRYEISNYAMPEAECIHNLACWRGLDYLGVGPSAVSRVSRRRRENVCDTDDYIRSLRSGRRPEHTEEWLSLEEDLTERFVTGLRLQEGVNPDQFCRMHPAAASLCKGWTQRLIRLQKVGLVVERRDNLSLTRRGREVIDGVVRELIP